MKDKLLQIISFYGLENQLKYIHSEYFELDEAIINYWNDETYYEEIEKSDKKHIAEEIADIMVMLKQFQYFYEITDKNIEDIMKKKIKRQLERIEEEEII